ncbi:MAG: YHS domain-containing protein [Planctomycetota bacterium]|nr:MAG: YHS domain-containing protein [Planctomycetota bacterium]
MKVLLLSLLPALLSLSPAVDPGANEFGAQTACPISGKAIDKAVSVDYEGHRVYFCCKGCPKKFKEFPDAYLVKMMKAKEAPENIQSTCVVSDQPLEAKEHYVEVLNKKIYTCCTKCQAKVAKDPASYLDKLEGRQAQSKCPVSGSKVDKNVFVEYQGQKVYFCCSGCEGKFKAEADKVFTKWQHAKVVTEAAASQTHCPLMKDEKVDKNTFVTYKGRRIYFCCAGCITGFAKKPGKVLTTL